VPDRYTAGMAKKPKPPTPLISKVYNITFARRADPRLLLGEARSSGRAPSVNKTPASGSRHAPFQRLAAGGAGWPRSGPTVVRLSKCYSVSGASGIRGNPQNAISLLAGTLTREITKLQEIEQSKSGNHAQAERLRHFGLAVVCRSSQRDDRKLVPAA
jgi:hypothetical protein